MRKILIFAGIIVFFIWSGAALAQKPFTAGAKYEYAIKLAGNDAGSFTMEIVDVDAKTISLKSNSKIVLPQTTLVIESRLKQTKEYVPISYFANVTVGGTSAEINVTVSNDTATINIAQTGQLIPERKIEVTGETLFADNNTFEQYYMVVRKFLALNQEKATLSVLIPQAFTVFKAVLTRKDPSEKTIGSKKYKVENVGMGIGPSYMEFTIDAKTHELLQIDIPAQNFSIIKK